jgi:imidazolonepropionase-like amidohydrolase
MALLVKVGGLTPAEALAAASLNGAKALRRDQEFGTITAGRLANLVILGADPLADIANTKSVRWVVKRGAFYRRP